MVYAGFGKPSDGSDDITDEDLLSVSATVDKQQLAPTIRVKPAPSTPVKQQSHHKKEHRSLDGKASPSKVKKEMKTSPSDVTKKEKKMLSDRPVVGIKREAPSGATKKLDKELWVEKYRPTQRKQLVGQNGAASPANRLLNWLSTWQSNFVIGEPIYLSFGL